LTQEGGITRRLERRGGQDVCYAWKKRGLYAGVEVGKHEGRRQF